MSLVRVYMDGHTEFYRDSLENKTELLFNPLSPPPRNMF